MERLRTCSYSEILDGIEIEIGCLWRDIEALACCKAANMDASCMESWSFEFDGEKLCSKSNIPLSTEINMTRSIVTNILIREIQDHARDGK